MRDSKQEELFSLEFHPDLGTRSNWIVIEIKLVVSILKFGTSS